MGSRQSNGDIITQSNNVLSVHSQSNYVKVRNAKTDEQTSSVVSTGICDTTSRGSGVIFTPNDMTFAQRKASSSLDYQKFIDSSGCLAYDIVRSEGAHVSISHLANEGTGVTSAAMRTKTDRKVFFTSYDRNKTTPQTDWTIYDGGGKPVGDATGSTDIDVTPKDT